MKRIRTSVEKMAKPGGWHLLLLALLLPALLLYTTLNFQVLQREGNVIVLVYNQTLMPSYLELGSVQVVAGVGEHPKGTSPPFVKLLGGTGVVALLSVVLKLLFVHVLCTHMLIVLGAGVDTLQSVYTLRYT